MKLVIVDAEGLVYEVVDDLEEYDLLRPIAQATLCEAIVKVIGSNEKLLIEQATSEDSETT